MHPRTTVLNRQSRLAYTKAASRYRKAYTIVMHWIKNNTEVNFRSLGSYSRVVLEAIAIAEDAF
jgi:hypothetical protein